jgi:hypothetical protein
LSVIELFHRKDLNDNDQEILKNSLNELKKEAVGTSGLLDASGKPMEISNKLGDKQKEIIERLTKKDFFTDLMFNEEKKNKPES